MPKNPTRIVHIFSRFKTYSGAEHLCFRFVAEARKKGQEVIIITRYFPESLAVHLPPGTEIRVLKWSHEPTRFHFLESICDVLYSPFLFTLIPQKSDFDIYWNDNTLAALFLDSVLRTKRRIFYCLQLPHFAYGQTLLVARSYPPVSWLVPILTPLYRWLDRLFARRADLIVTLSQMVRNDCKRVYQTSAVVIAGPGIDTPREELVDPSFIRRNLSIRSQYIFLTAGKIVPKKNFDVFVRIVHDLRGRGLDIEGVIIGDGPFRSRIETLIRQLNLEEYCLMTGFVEDYDDVLRYMSGATIYFYLEKKVPFGLTPLEAGSVRVPVVAYEGGGVEETVVQGENGIKVPLEYDAFEIADLVAGLLSKDPSELTRMGVAGRQIASRWTWAKAYERFLDVIGAEEPQGTN